MKFKIINIILLIILNIKFIQSQYNDYVYNYYINGTGGSDENYCGIEDQCYSVEKVIYYFLNVISYNTYYTYPSLVIHISEGGSFFSNIDYKSTTSSSSEISSINLYQFNITLLGVNDENGNQVTMVNNNSIPVFTVQPDSWLRTTVINIINLNYGGSGECITSGTNSGNISNSGSSNSDSSSNNNDNGDFIQVLATYNIPLSISFIDFNYSCTSNDKSFILVSGELNGIIDTSQDWDDNGYYNTAFYTTSYSFTFINSIFSSASTSSNQQQLLAPIFKSKYCPLTISLIESTFNNNLQPLVPAFIIGRGQLIVEKSNFISDSSSSGNTNQFQCLGSIFEIFNVEVYFNNNQVSMWPVHQNKLIECNGCFFTGVGNVISSSFYSTDKSCSTNNPSLLSFSRSSVTIMNSNLTMTNVIGYSNTIQQDANLIYGTSQSQISLRSNLISSSIGSALNYNSVKSFMYSNIFSDSYKPYIHCHSDTFNIFNGDKFSTNLPSTHGYNCNKNLQNSKLNNALIFSSIGIAVTFGSLIFLYVSRYSIKRCSGPLNDYNHIKY